MKWHENCTSHEGNGTKTVRVMKEVALSLYELYMKLYENCTSYEGDRTKNVRVMNEAARRLYELQRRWHSYV